MSEEVCDRVADRYRPYRGIDRRSVRRQCRGLPRPGRPIERRGHTHRWFLIFSSTSLDSSKVMARHGVLPIPKDRLQHGICSFPPAFSAPSLFGPRRRSEITHYCADPSRYVVLVSRLFHPTLVASSGCFVHTSLAISGNFQCRFS